MPHTPFPKGAQANRALPSPQHSKTTLLFCDPGAKPSWRPESTIISVEHKGEIDGQKGWISELRPITACGWPVMRPEAPRLSHWDRMSHRALFLESLSHECACNGQLSVTSLQEQFQGPPSFPHLLTVVQKYYTWCRIQYWILQADSRHIHCLVKSEVCWLTHSYYSEQGKAGGI